MTSMHHPTDTRQAPRTRPAPLLSGLAVAALGLTLTTTGTVAADLATAAPAQAACTSNFTDVPRTHGFYQAVTWANCQGITGGYGNGSFGVTKPITRGEVATMLYRQVSPKHPKTTRSYFKDVAKGRHYSQAVNWLAQSGLTAGYSGRTFKPNQPITRGEVSAMLYRLSGTKYTGPAKSPFRDMKRTTGFYNAATWMKSKRLVGGYSDGTFRPSRNLTRGETVVMLKNSHPIIKNRGDVTTPVMQPLPASMERASSVTASWKATAATWATNKATDPKALYKLGGNGPYAYDCSGFTTGAFSAGGKALPRTSKAQYTAADKKVPISQAKAGDLVYWSNNGAASGVYHVAIVVDEDTIAHARNPSSGVTLTDINYSKTNMLPNAGRFN